jgi:hypothetical protein
MFLQAQGYDVLGVILYQDNKSAMLLERNCKASSSIRTKQIHIRYFCIKDKVDWDEVRLEHCPMEERLTDFFTKPLQGNLLRKLRDRIMNIDPSSEYHSTSIRTVLDYYDGPRTDVLNTNTDVGEKGIIDRTNCIVSMDPGSGNSPMKSGNESQRPTQ